MDAKSRLLELDLATADAKLCQAEAQPGHLENVTAQAGEAWKVPLHWRQRVAAAIYLGTRHGEFEALQWEDITLEHGTIHIHRTINRTKQGKKRETKPTKTKHPRRFAVEPNLIPLLKVLQKPSGLVFEPLNNTEYSYRLRVFLKRAGVTRADLFTRDATRKQLTWHDTRATHATWSAVRGDPTSKIKFRIGHSRTDTTDIYVREGEQLRDGFGTVFPALPDCILMNESSTQSSTPLVENCKQQLFCWNVASPTRFEGVARCEFSVIHASSVC